MTKKDLFEAIKAIMVGEETEIAKEEIAAFCEKEIAALDGRAAKAKERSAAKKVESNALAEKIAAALTITPQTIADITAAINDPEVTVHRVTYYLGRLVEAGVAKREEVVLPPAEGQKTRRVKAFSLA